LLLKDIFRKKTIDSILKDAGAERAGGTGMKRSLNLRDLTSLGIAAIIGAGIFSTIGNTASSGGPAVSLLFVFVAIACALSALCYARFASVIPISGSAYTYAYASFGELIAWIIGWVLIMEYSFGNIAVAISWSDYFTGLLSGLGVTIPQYLTIDYLSAVRGHREAADIMVNGGLFNDLPVQLQTAWAAFENAPRIGNLAIIADLPAFSIVVFISVIIYIGISEAKTAGNVMVLLKVIILLLVIGVGAFYVNPGNWKPFAPEGISGVMKGVSGVFFAYIGFDAISTTAEECKNPQRDIPRAMIYALIITTVLYVLISLVLTGMVHYKDLAVGDPMAYVFQNHDLNWLSGVIALSAVIAMASVLLVFQVGQPRIWMSMSRDGLLPKRFSKLHPRFQTPAFATIITCIVVAVPSLFMNLTEVTDLTAIGTLFVFALVSGGVLLLDPPGPPALSGKSKGFRIPYANSRYWVPIIWTVILFLMLYFNGNEIILFFQSDVLMALSASTDSLKDILPLMLFIVSAVLISVYAVIRQWSLIPVSGLLINLYLMSELGIDNWVRFIIWLAAGVVLYFAYSFRKSKLRNNSIS